MLPIKQELLIMRSIRRNTLIFQVAIVVLTLAFFIAISVMFRRNYTDLSHARERDEIRRIDEIIGIWKCAACGLGNPFIS